MHVTKADVDAVKRAWSMLPRNDDAPKFNIRPISEAWRWSSRRPAYRTATANVGYIWRDASPTDRFGPMPRSFEQRRCELRASGLMLPSSAPLWATEGYRVWEDADRAVFAIDNPHGSLGVARGHGNSDRYPCRAVAPACHRLCPARVD